MFITGDALEVKGNVMISVNSTHPFHNFLIVTVELVVRRNFEKRLCQFNCFRNPHKRLWRSFVLSEVSKSIRYLDFHQSGMWLS